MFANVEKLIFHDIYGLDIFTVPTMPQVKTLLLSDVNVAIVNFNSQTELEELRLELEMTGVTDFSGLTTVKRFNILNGNSENYINMDSMVALEEFTAENSYPSEINFIDWPLLKKIKFVGNWGSPSFDLTTLEYLEHIEIVGGSPVQLGYQPNLTYLSLEMFEMESLDLSGCVALQTLTLASIELDYLNLKNGNIPENIAIDGVFADVVCADEDEIELLNSDTYFDTEVTHFTTYCTPTPGGNFNTIKGTVRFATGSCETGILAGANIRVKINDGATTGYTYTNNEGKYEFYVPSGIYVITADVENSWTQTPTQISLTTDDATIVQNLCLSPGTPFNDAEISIVPIEGARPGFDAVYNILIKNKGNQASSGTVNFTYSDDVLDFVEALPAQDVLQGGSVTWNYTNLLPAETKVMTVRLNVNGPMETPPVNIGDVLNYTVTITPTATDATTADNTFDYNEQVVGSFDPNDITCLEGAVVSPDKIGEYLHYNINFENTGTAAATFIVVKDVIDATQFDINSLQILGSSHEMTARIIGDKIKFRFDDINLAPEGNGNIVFKIKTNNNLQIGDSVTQKAEIFFDYNWPIITNDAITVFQVLSRGDFTKDDSVSVFPNPANNVVTVKANSAVKTVELYDVQGRLLQVVNTDTIDVSKRASGLYLLKVRTEKGMKVEKLVRE